MKPNITSAFRGTEPIFCKQAPQLFSLCGETRLTVRTLALRGGTGGGTGPCRHYACWPGFFSTSVGRYRLGWMALRRDREAPNVDNRRRGSNSRPHRRLDSSASDSVLSRNLSLSKHVESRSQ